jgi:predicted nucleotidyltransferase
MNAEADLIKLARLFAEINLQAVMIGNAAAAINGSPVTTLDVDFIVPQTPQTYRAIVLLAQKTDSVLQELKLIDDRYMYQLIPKNPEGIQLDFLYELASKDRYEKIKERARPVDFDGNKLHVAALEDIIRAKQAANRPKDVAVLPILNLTLEEQQRKKGATE